MSSTEDNFNYKNTSQEDTTEAPKPPVSTPFAGWKLFAGYLVVWVLLLIIMKRIYTVWRSASLQNRRNKWFGKHAEREVYEEAVAAAAKNPSSQDEEVLRKALLRRAMTDVRRFVQLNSEKDSLYNLMRSGAVSEEMWNEFKEAENEMQLELFDLQAEAETFKEGWSEKILVDAAELVKKEDSLMKIKRDREQEEKQKRTEEKRAVRQKEVEERTMKEQEERAARLREKFLASEDGKVKSN